MTNRSILSVGKHCNTIGARGNRGFFSELSSEKNYVLRLGGRGRNLIEQAGPRSIGFRKESPATTAIPFEGWWTKRMGGGEQTNYILGNCFDRRSRRKLGKRSESQTAGTRRDRKYGPDRSRIVASLFLLIVCKIFS